MIMKYRNQRFTTIILATFIVLSLSDHSFAQGQINEKPGKRDKSQWVTGGNFGIGYSSGSLNLGLAPQIGYRITDRWEFGTRLTYNYFHYKLNETKFSSHQFGGGFYTLYDLIAGFFAQAENEWLSYEKIYFDPNNLDVVNFERSILHSVFVGGGYRQALSDRSSVGITVLFNLNDTPDSPYSNPIVRIGFGFGL